MQAPNRLLTRILAVSLLATLAVQSGALPALAMSTQTEIAQGTTENAEIDASSIVITDPFLVSWTNQVGSKLAAHRKRQDITYRFTVLDDPSINAFAIKGGYVHVNVGLLNFASSDDELASVMGHEMGHVEMRHVVKSSNINTVIGILTALVSILSPVASVLGALGGELANDKYSRTDELQADHYGLSLMSQAGYDPNAAIDVMTKLGAMDPGPDSRADKAFLDHPNPSDRVSHLLGYPELDKPSSQSLFADVIHNQSEGRYSYARVELTSLASAQDPQIETHVVQLNYALRESGPKAAPDGRVFVTVVERNDPARVAAVKAITAGHAMSQQATSDAKLLARKGFVELQLTEHHLNNLENGGPSFRFTAGDSAYWARNAASIADAGATPSPTPATSSGATAAPSPTPTSGPPGPGQPPGPGGPPPSGQTRTTASGMATLSKVITGTINPIADVLSTAPGLTVGNTDAFREMLDPLTEDAPLTPKFQALLVHYPSMISDLDGSTKGLLASIELARAALAQADIAVEATRAALYVPPVQQNPNGIATPAPRPPPDLRSAIAAWNTAMQTAKRASNVMYAAQAATLSSEITLLDLMSSPGRYAAYRDALAVRFPGVAIPDYQAARTLGVGSGEIVCAAWMSFETKKEVAAILTSIKDSGRSCEAQALDQALMAESMEIALGLVYEDYIDEPQRHAVAAKATN
jgi:Zn-dependent protease with chaperone function